MKSYQKAKRALPALALIAMSLQMTGDAYHAAWGAEAKETALSKPKLLGRVSVEEAIQKRRSVRAYESRNLDEAQVSQLLWACQGITEPQRRLRASPSAGASYPLVIYALTSDGVFRYVPETHSLATIEMQDRRPDLERASRGQKFLSQAPLDIVIAASYDRVTRKYGERGVRFTDMEAGHAAENVALQAVALGLASVPVAAFSEEAVAGILKLDPGVTPIYILPVGHPSGKE